MTTSWAGHYLATDGAQHVLLAGGDSSSTPRIVANFSNPSSAGAYAAGDIIANSGTGSAVVPITFTTSTRVSGRITGVRCVVTPATGSLVITALAFDLLLFRPETSVPFAAAGYPADNAQMTITAAAMRELVGVFSFNASSWRSGLGSTTVAGASGYQSQALNSTRAFAPFNVDGLSGIPIGVVQAQGAWTPGAVINRFDFALDIDFN